MLGIVKKCAFVLFLLSGLLNNSFSQTSCENYQAVTPSYTGTWNTTWNFTNMKQNKVGGLNIGGDYFFLGMLEYLPQDYAPANTTIKHPLIIYFHGNASKGSATANINNLCRLFKDNGNDDKATYKSLPGRVERNNDEFTKAGKEYIVISPQFDAYRRVYPEPASPNQNIYPSAQQVENVINFVIARYPGKIDESRIYLTGYSNGANMIMEYAGSSLARAKRVAAVMPVSLCSQLTHPSNTSIGVSAANIANAGLKTWFVHCTNDNPCAKTVPDEWINAINANGGIAPRYSVLSDANADPLYQCSDTLLHDAWSRAYDPVFKASFVNGTGANDGVNLNAYDWFIAQTNSALPVTLKNFTAKLTGGKVELKWVTTEEKNNAAFIVERAGTDQVYAAIATMNGAGDYVGEKEYTYTDNSPLADLNFYRLVQTDRDGKRNYFDIRKIINKINTSSSVIVSPNPFTTEITAYISVQQPQKVSIFLTDMNGRILRSLSGVYGKGSSELKFPSQDLSKGIYMLKVFGENFSTTQKVIRK